MWYSLLHAPVSLAAMVTIIIVFLGEMRETNGRGITDGALKMGAFYKPYVQQGQWYRLLTAGFVHFSWYHLLMNAWVLLNLGPYLENIFGSVLYAILLFGSIVLGNLMMYWIGNGHAVSGGLSSGLYGLMAAELVLIYGLYGPAAILRNSSLLYSIVINLIFNFMPGVGWQAHLGGACFGVVFTVLLLHVI